MTALLARALTQIRTMRISCVLTLASLIGVGCAVRPTQVATQAGPPPDYGNAVAASLVFDPPVTAGAPELDLSREGRQPSAFVSYDQVTSSFFYLRFQDRQFVGSDGRSERRVITETFGISHK